MRTLLIQKYSTGVPFLGIQREIPFFSNDVLRCRKQLLVCLYIDMKNRYMSSFITALCSSFFDFFVHFSLVIFFSHCSKHFLLSCQYQFFVGWVVSSSFQCYCRLHFVEFQNLGSSSLGSERLLSPVKFVSRFSLTM